MLAHTMLAPKHSCLKSSIDLEDTQSLKERLKWTICQTLGWLQFKALSSGYFQRQCRSMYSEFLNYGTVILRPAQEPSLDQAS